MKVISISVSFIYLVMIIVYIIKWKNSKLPQVYNDNVNAKSLNANYYTFVLSSWIAVDFIIGSLGFVRFRKITALVALLLCVFAKSCKYKLNNKWDVIANIMGGNFGLVFPIYFLWDKVLHDGKLNEMTVENDIGYVVYWSVLIFMLLSTNKKISNIGNSIFKDILNDYEINNYYNKMVKELKNFKEEQLDIIEIKLHKQKNNWDNIKSGANMVPLAAAVFAIRPDQINENVDIAFLGSLLIVLYAIILDYCGRQINEIDEKLLILNKIREKKHKCKVKAYKKCVR